MEYISKLDKKSFTNKESLIQHLLENYSIEAEESNHSDIINRIEKEAPYVEVESVTNDDKDNVKIEVQYKNEQGAYLDGETVILGKVTNYDYWDYTVCDSLDAVIAYLSNYYSLSRKIEEMIIDKFNGDNYALTGIYCGGHDNNAHIYFSFDVEDETFKCSYDLGDSFDELFNQINSNFVKHIEGNVENYWDSCNNEEVFRVSGVEVKSFLKNGMKVKIEIID